MGYFVQIANMPEATKLYDTVVTWWDAIEVLIVTGATTAKVEAGNTGIKNIKRTGRGFRNAENYRTRILLTSAARTEREYPPQQGHSPRTAKSPQWGSSKPHDHRDGDLRESIGGHPQAERRSVVAATREVDHPSHRQRLRKAQADSEADHDTNGSPRVDERQGDQAHEPDSHRDQQERLAAERSDEPGQAESATTETRARRARSHPTTTASTSFSVAHTGTKA